MEALQNAIQGITWRSKIFPKEEFKIICANKTAAIPYLREAVKKAVAERENLDDNYQLHFYAMYLLAEFQDRDFFPEMMKMACLPEEALDFLLGDAITDSLDHILYNTYNGELPLLKEAIFKPAVYDYAKSAMLRVMGQLYLDGRIEKQDWQEFLRQIVYGDTIGEYVYETVADLICSCHFVEMLPEIYRLYQDERMEGTVIGGYDMYVDDMFTYRERKERICQSSVNAAETLKGWAMFENPDREMDDKKREQNFAKAFRSLEREFMKTEPRRKIGRNDPCPCGSGKKYKQCCLNKPKAPVDLVESEQEKAKWLKDYPAAKTTDGAEGRVYLEDYYNDQSIQIDKLLYLALMHRAIPIWRREDGDVIDRRKRVYLSAAFDQFRALAEEENISSFQEYDSKYAIHYHCEDWLEILQELLRKEDDQGILGEVQELCEKMRS